MAKTLVRKRANRTSTASSYKVKTKKAAAKRYKVLGSGKVKVPHCNKQHNTGPKRRSHKNRLKKAKIMREESTRHVKRCLPNSF